MSGEIWVSFYIGGKQVCAYTLRGSFPGELTATREDLAYSYQVPESEIEVRATRGKANKMTDGVKILGEKGSELLFKEA